MPFAERQFIKMNVDEIKNKVIELLRELLPDSDIDPDTLEYADLVDDFGMDSMIFISILVEIEASYDISIPDNMLLINNFRKVNDIIDIISNIINNQLHGE